MEPAYPRLAEGCSVILSSGTKMFHDSDWLFPSFHILPVKFQAEKHHVLMVAGSQRHAFLGKAVGISRQDHPTSVVTHKKA